VGAPIVPLQKIAYLGTVTVGNYKVIPVCQRKTRFSRVLNVLRLVLNGATLIISPGIS
jgi:hypothetical protein